MYMKTIIVDQNASKFSLVIESSTDEPHVVYIYAEPRGSEATICVNIEDIKLALRKHSTK